MTIREKVWVTIILAVTIGVIGYISFGLSLWACAIAFGEAGCGS